MSQQSKLATDNLFPVSETVQQPALLAAASTTPTTTSATPTTTSTDTTTITTELCQQLTICVTSLHSHACELRVARACRRNPALRQRWLAELDRRLTAVEERTQTLVDVVNAEQDAVRKIRAQHHFAKEQQEHLISFQENLPNLNGRAAAVHAPGVQEATASAVAPLQERSDTTPTTAQPSVTSTTSASDLLIKWNRTRHQRTTMDSEKDEYRSATISHDKVTTQQQVPDKKLIVQQQQHQNPTSTARPHHHHLLFEQQQQHHQMHHQQPKHGLTDPITIEELEQIPRTTRGRISLYVLNDALSDIAAHCRRRARKKTKSHSPFSSSPPPYPVDDCAMRVEEQELRQSCSFFRTGESTARSILLILRTLGRLQQIPAKHGEVTYIVGY